MYLNEGVLGSPGLSGSEGCPLQQPGPLRIAGEEVGGDAATPRLQSLRQYIGTVEIIPCGFKQSKAGPHLDT